MKKQLVALLFLVFVSSVGFGQTQEYVVDLRYNVQSVNFIQRVSTTSEVTVQAVMQVGQSGRSINTLGNLIPTTVRPDIAKVKSFDPVTGKIVLAVSGQEGVTALYITTPDGKVLQRTESTLPIVVRSAGAKSDYPGFVSINSFAPKDGSKLEFDLVVEETVLGPFEYEVQYIDPKGRSVSSPKSTFGTNRLYRRGDVVRFSENVPDPGTIPGPYYVTVDVVEQQGGFPVAHTTVKTSVFDYGYPGDIEPPFIEGGYYDNNFQGGAVYGNFPLDVGEIAVYVDGKRVRGQVFSSRFSVSFKIAAEELSASEHEVMLIFKELNTVVRRKGALRLPVKASSREFFPVFVPPTPPPLPGAPKASFNTSPVSFSGGLNVDHPVIDARNLTRGDTWSTSHADYQDGVNASPGDVLEFFIYYRNNGPGDAMNTVIDAQLPIGIANNQLVSATLQADNANSFGGGINVNVGAVARKLVFVPGSVQWLPDQGQEPKPRHIQAPDELVTSGINIGVVKPGFEHHGFVLFRLQVSN